MVVSSTHSTTYTRVNSTNQGSVAARITTPYRRTVLYIRVSTEEQALEGFSLPDQERRGRAAALKRGADVEEVYTDHHTGKSRNRPGLKRLLADAQAGTVGTVILTEVDRLARRASHALAIDEELRRYGAGCVFLEQSIDTTYHSKNSGAGILSPLSRRAVE